MEQTILPPLPDFFIGKILTKERIDNYASQKHSLLTQALGRPDTKSVWYSKQHIQQLLDEVEYAHGDGLRIFFGAYGESHPYRGQTCLLMVITREETNGGVTIHRNVVIEDEQPERAEQARIEQARIEQLAAERPRAKGIEAVDKGLPKDFNHGSPCPPLCDFNEGFEFPE